MLVRTITETKAMNLKEINGGSQCMGGLEGGYAKEKII